MSDPGASPIDYHRPQPPGVSARLVRAVGLATIGYHGLIVAASLVCADVVRMAFVTLWSPGKYIFTWRDVVSASLVTLFLSLPHLVSMVQGCFLLGIARTINENRDLGVRRCERYYAIQLLVLLIAWLGTAMLVMSSLGRFHLYSPWGISSVVTAIAAVLPLVIANQVLVAKDPAYRDDEDDA